MENNSTKTNQIVNRSAKVKPKKARKVPAAAKAPKIQATLEFAEPDKAGFRYAQGRIGRFAIGTSRHHDSEFALYKKKPEMSRFKFLGKFEDLMQARAAAEKVDAERDPELSTVTANGNG
jgi:hypothetical protein